MRMTTGVVLLVLLAGCGGGADAKPKSPPSSSQPPVASLAETCPEIEAALPAGLIPKAAKWDAYADRLAELSTQGDTETQNAVDLLMPAVENLAADPVGVDLLDARDELRTGLDVIAVRCRAVGSSALQ